MSDRAQTDRASVTAGFTPRAVAASLLGILILSIMIQLVGVTDAWNMLSGSESLPIPALGIGIAFVCVAALFRMATKWRLLTRAELYVVFFSCLIASPLCAHGFWRYMLSVTTRYARDSDWEKLDHFSDRLWPHGPNLIEDAFAEKRDANVSTRGNVATQAQPVERDPDARVAVLTNTAEDTVSAIRIRLPVRRDDQGILLLNQSYLTTIKGRAENLGGNAKYFCRIYYDEHPTHAEELFSSRRPAEASFLQPEGFVPLGRYGVTFPADRVRESVMIEFGLEGVGTVAFLHPRLMDVSALEGAFFGRRSVSPEAYAKIPVAERGAYIARPESLWSTAGLRYLVTGAFPARAWRDPLLAWGLFAALILSATFAIAAIMRRQWIQNERYPLPMAQVPLALLDIDDATETRRWPKVFSNRIFWAGLAISAAWCLLRAWHKFNPSIPDTAIDIPLKSYISGPGWGNTWNGINFTVTAFFFGLALFVELNVLASIVLGFLLYRMQFWFGEAYGLAADQGYPYGGSQILGSYLAYAGLILILTRKHLAGIVRQAWTGKRDAEDVLSPRAALLLLALSLGGAWAWASWTGIGHWGTLVFFIYLVTLGMVAMKLRAECGILHHSFTPTSILLTLIGGLGVFGADTFLFTILAAAVFSSICFFVVPGMQLELIEVGRRVGVKPSHRIGAVVLGVAGGLLLGGWVYMATAYAEGADNYPIATGEFRGKGDMKIFNTELKRADESFHGTGTGQSKNASARNVALAVGAGGTTLVTVLRQFFAGFWFHPIGFILGPTAMAGSVWGSVLLAWLMRFLVLRLGGAATVREKLLPFATGVVLGSVLVYLMFIVINGYVFFFNPGAKHFVSSVPL